MVHTNSVLKSYTFYGSSDLNISEGQRTHLSTTPYGLNVVAFDSNGKGSEWFSVDGELTKDGMIWRIVSEDTGSEYTFEVYGEVLDY